MVYIKQEWRNVPATDTPIGAAQLQHIEDGIWAADDTAAQAAAGVGSLTTAKAETSQVQVVIKQVGALYPIPSSAFASKRYFGTLDPATQSGLPPLTDYDEWITPL